LSFTSLTHLALASGIAPTQAWAWPLIVDGIIVVATVAVVAMAGRAGAWYPWLLLAGGAVVSVTANAIQAAIAPDVAVPTAMAAAVAAVPPVVLLAITHLTVVLTRHTSPAVSRPPVRSGTRSEPRSGTEPGPGAVHAMSVGGTGGNTPAPNPRPGAVVDQGGTAPTVDAGLPRRAQVTGLPGQPGRPGPGDGPGGGVKRAGRRPVVPAGAGMSSAWKQARALELHQSGSATTRIVSELGVSKSTVNRWLRTHRSPTPTTGPPAPGPTPRGGDTNGNTHG
jgi:hypothetical protein